MSNGNLGLYEIMDRSGCISGRFQRDVLDHPEIGANAELKAAADKIADALGDFYQLAGQHYFATAKDDDGAEPSKGE